MVKIISFRYRIVFHELLEWFDQFANLDQTEIVLLHQVEEERSNHLIVPLRYELYVGDDIAENRVGTVKEQSKSGIDVQE